MRSRLTILLLLLIPLSTAAPPLASCPPVPSKCSCEPGDSGMLLVSCEEVLLSNLFKDLGALPLEQLRITKCNQPNLDILPKGFIRSLEISDCGIQRVDSKIFVNTLNVIEEIILVNNSLTEVPSFGKLSRLSNLNLNGNNISDVPDNVFAGVPSLQQLRLERNSICNLSTKAFEEIKNNLRLLDLSGNCLSKIPATNLRNSQKLLYLDLADNQISEINNFELMNMPQLQEIRLNNNELRTMHPMAIMNVPQLKYLFIRDNLLSSLDGDKLQGLSQLEVLDVTNNLLTKVPKLKDFSKLKRVLLDGNLIEMIETLTFSNCTQLQLISLQNNNIVQISRNSFESLDQMQVLLLGNNSLASIERGILDGMPRLGFLHARNNSISKIDSHAFSSVVNLQSLDLAHNALERVEPKTFQNLGKLMWLDVSNNRLQGFEKDSFSQKIETMLLDGNEWMCDEKFDWFVMFLVTNRVRTFLPQQKEIDCSGPAQQHGVRLRDLMMKKSDEMTRQRIQTTGLNKQGQTSLLSSFIPGLGNWNPLAGLSIPQAGTQSAPQATKSNSPVQQPAQSFIVNIPGFGDFDLSKIDPNLLDYVLKGGQVPGIPKETMDGVIQSYMKKVYEATAAAKAGKLTKEQEKFLVPTNLLPQQMLQNMNSGQLSEATEERTSAITEYKTASGSLSSGPVAASGPSVNTGAMAELWKLLPPGYNISKIPQEVLSSVMKGELPDLKKLPADLMTHFQANSEKLTSLFTKLAPTNVTLDDLLAKLPKFEKPVLATFSPYDINKLSSDMIHEEQIRERAAKMKIYTVIALAAVGAITIIVLVFFVVYLKKQRANKTRGLSIPGIMRPQVL